MTGDWLIDICVCRPFAKWLLLRWFALATTTDNWGEDILLNIKNGCIPKMDTATLLLKTPVLNTGDAVADLLGYTDTRADDKIIGG